MTRRLLMLAVYACHQTSIRSRIRPSDLDCIIALPYRNMRNQDAPSKKALLEVYVSIMRLLPWLVATAATD